MPPFNLKETNKLLTTTRAVRRRLDFEKPVPREVILECLDISQQAPTGSNRQGWRWIIVTSSEKREALADIYRRSAGEYLVKSQDEAAANGDNQTERVYSSAQYLAENLEKVPVHVIPLIKVDHMAKKPTSYGVGRVDGLDHACSLEFSTCSARSWTGFYFDRSSPSQRE